MPGLKKITPFFSCLLLPLFFCVHGWYEAYKLISLTDFIQAFFILSCVCLILYVVFTYLISVQENIELTTTLSMSILLFSPFGLQEEIAFLDFNNPLHSTILSSILLLGIFIFIRFRKKNYSSLTKYIRSILAVLVIVDLCILLVSLRNDPPIQPKSFIKSNENKQSEKPLPSVYIILLDEYAGDESLIKFANFDNSAFWSELKNIGFQVVSHSRSNYNHTILSMASFLNADYNQFKKIRNDKNYYKQSLAKIENNAAVATFTELGYQIKNFSPFHLNEHERFYASFSVPSGAEIIISPTILDDIYNNGMFFITRRLPDKTMFEQLVKRKTAFNQEILDSILNYSKSNKTPSFCFAHLNMPHAIYAKDSTGKINIPFLTKRLVTVEDRKNAYLQQLVYTNRLVLPYLRQLKKNMNNSDILLIMSDHGYRDFKVDKTNSPSFNNILAVYSADIKKASWQEGFSNVNIFRNLFSEITGAEIPLLKDSIFTEFIRE